MAVIHIDKKTPVSKLAEMAQAAKIQLRWRPSPATQPEPENNKVVLLRRARPANDDQDLPPAA